MGAIVVGASVIIVDGIGAIVVGASVIIVEGAFVIIVGVDVSVARTVDSIISRHFSLSK